MHAKEDNGRLRAAATYLPRCLNAIQYRHCHVHYDNVRLVLLRKRNRFAAIGGLRNNTKTFVAFEQQAKAFPYDRVVVRKKNSDSSHYFSRRSP
jgi:hypothetical protein